MHGRLKVKTTEEQQEAKRKEREKKLKLYTAGTQKIFEKRKNKEYDGELLEVCAQLLSANPDFYTLWNIRKETFQFFTETKTPDEMQSLFDRELGFIEMCLRVNPKSYGAWYHRCWVMDHTPKPDWKQELKLCNLYLDYDERNFHCWDYRRFVVAKSKVAPSEELQFTSTKISSNFSNYSSWHYRSKLLPVLHPDKERRGRLQEDILMQEYDLVQNAFFTDPNDQSAWFYHRWLMGRGEKPLGVQLIYVDRTLRQVMATFSQPVNLLRQPAEVSIGGSHVEGTWRNSRGSQYHSIMWIFTIEGDALLQQGGENTLQVKMNEDVCRSCQLKQDVNECWSKDDQETSSLFTAELSDEKTEFLTTELESCQQLREIEPDNKWCLLTVILLMRVLDPLKHENEMLSCFKTILSQDTYRANYFKDLRSKFIMENTIMRYLQESSKVTESQKGEVVFDVSRKDLTSLHHLHHLSSVRSVDLSNNDLLALNDVDLLFCVSNLKADNNKLEDISHLRGLQCLETLSLKNNNISLLSQLEPLKACPNLRQLNLSGNPVCDLELFRSEVIELLPQITSINAEAL